MEEKIFIEPILKARDKFEKFRKNLETEQKKTGAVHSLKYCYEIALQLMKEILEKRGVEVGSPKDTFRKAFEEKLIDDPEQWFEFQKLRNLTMHAYEEKNF